MLVLNATYEPVNVCTVRRAVVLLLKDKAEIVEHAERELHSANNSMSRPVVIRLVTYVRNPARYAPTKDHPQGGVRARRVDLPVLRLSRAADGRPCRAPLEGWRLDVGQHRRGVCSMQPQKR